MAVRAYQLLPYDVARRWSATPCRWSRSRSALLLVLGLLTRPAAVVGGLLMLAFLVGIISAWARGLTIDCGCFGGGGTIAAAQTHYLSETPAGHRARAVRDLARRPPPHRLQPRPTTVLTGSTISMTSGSSSRKDKATGGGADGRGPNRAVIGAVVAVLVVVGVVVAIVLGSGGSTAPGAGSTGSSASSALPAGADRAGRRHRRSTRGKAKAGAPTLDLYEDFQCPICGQLEKLFGAQIRSMAAAGDITPGDPHHVVPGHQPQERLLPAGGQRRRLRRRRGPVQRVPRRGLRRPAGQGGPGLHRRPAGRRSPRRPASPAGR